MNKKAIAFSRAGFYPRAEETEASFSVIKSNQMGNGRVPVIDPFLLGPPQIPSSRGNILTTRLCKDILDMAVLLFSCQSQNQHKREKGVEGEIEKPCVIIA